MIVVTAAVDSDLDLQGDEDGGVTLICRVCDRRPIAYYSYPGDSTFQETSVITVDKITSLMAEGMLHLRSHI